MRWSLSVEHLVSRPQRMAYWDNFSWVSSTSPITNLLEKDDTTLENVLDEDEILSELRNANESLIR